MFSYLVKLCNRVFQQAGTTYRLYNNLVVQAIPGSSVAMKVLPESLVGELQVGKSHAMRNELLTHSEQG